MTINAGTAQDRGDTRIGNANLFLAYTHVAHDCVVGNGTTFSNNAQLAGHVHIDDWVVMGAYSGVHQFCRVGAHAMIAAGAIVLQDVPPFVTAAGYPATPRGINTEGLRRRGFAAEDILAVRRAYKTLYREGRHARRCPEALAAAAGTSPPLSPLVEFLACPGAASSGRSAWPTRASRSGGVTIGIVAGEASGDALAATLIRAVRERLPHARFVGIAGPRMEAAGCEAWYPLEMLSVRGLVEVISRLPQLVALRRALFRAPRRRAGAGIRRRRCAGLQSRPRGETEAQGRAQPAFRQPVGVGVAPRTVAHDRPFGAPDARAVPVRAAAVRSGRHSRHVRRSSAGGGCGGRWARGAKRASS